MLKRGLTLCLVLGVASIANAGALLEIDLVPSANAANPVGWYDPGETVDFSVFMSTDRGVPTQARLITIGFHDTDPALTFVGTEFGWDWSTLASNALYSKFLEYPRVNVTYQSTDPIAGFILEIPADGALLLGGGQVIAPMADGAYALDVLNVGGFEPGGGGGGNLNQTARLDFDFDNPTTWTAYTGEITGQPGMINVPEPATLALLALGGVAVLRRRRS
jgi:hypothetical protein